MPRIISSPQRDITDRSRRIDTWNTSVQTRHRPPWIYGTEQARRRWRDRSALPREPTPGVVIKRRHTTSRTMASRRRCRLTSCSRNARRTEQRFDQLGQVGEVLDQLFNAGLLWLGCRVPLSKSRNTSARDIVLKDLASRAIGHNDSAVAVDSSYRLVEARQRQSTRLRANSPDANSWN
jgi:hypothetical protein